MATKAELVATIATKAELTKKDAEKALAAFQEAVQEELVKEASSLKVEELEDFIKKYSSNPELKEAISSAFADDEVKKTAMAIFNRIEKESQESSLDNAIAALASSAVQSCK